MKFKVAAKTDVGLMRTNNEDNFQISWDLSSLPMRWVNNELQQLGNKGCLLVVADGMGGANAGEIASKIAIDSIKNSFSPEKLTDKILSSKDAINSFIKDAIVLADEDIKSYAQDHIETKGMGTTIVVAWILNDKLYIGWCGDSRAYVYNSAYGLLRLTKDHSYVQQLVDSGKLSEDEAFDYPDSNIITQCLSASSQKCHPATLSKPFDLSNNDIILLCTDGLCGMIRDFEISTILSNANGDISQCADLLVRSALNASGADNVTLCLFNVISGLKKASPLTSNQIKKNNRFYLAISILLLIIVAITTWIIGGYTSRVAQKNNIELKDSTVIENKLDSIIEEDSTTVNDTSITNRNDENRSSAKSEKQLGNRNNLLKGLKDVDIHKSTNVPNETIKTNVENTSDPEISIVKVPANKQPRIFLKDYDMNMSDFKKLNPGIDPSQISAGDSIKVYKIKNKQ